MITMETNALRASILAEELIPPVTLQVKEPGSALTHFMGFVAALTSSPFLVKRFSEAGQDLVGMVSAIVFLASMLLLYGASTAYHTFSFKKIGPTLVLKKMAHLMIFVLIAGTYTPLCLTVLRFGCGPLLLALVWTVAIIGMVFKLCWVTCPKWVSSVLYVVMGWLCVMAFPQILVLMPRRAFFLLLSGGIVYTIGAVIYAVRPRILDRISPCFGSHEVFHLFVMAGTVLQYMAIYESV